MFFVIIIFEDSLIKYSFLILGIVEIKGYYFQDRQIFIRRMCFMEFKVIIGYIGYFYASRLVNKGVINMVGVNVLDDYKKKWFLL